MTYKSLKQSTDIDAPTYHLATNTLSYYPTPSDEDIVWTMVYKLYEALQQGNTCLPLEQIANTTFCEKISLPSVADLCAHFTNWRTLHLDEFPFHLDETLAQPCIVIDRYHAYENIIFDFVSARRSQKLLELNPVTTAFIDILCPQERTATQQIQAVKMASQASIMVLNGGPGTGKTFTVSRILTLLKALYPEQTIALAAPTGKAAQRLSESLAQNISALKQYDGAYSGHSIAEIVERLPTQAVTLHRLLGIRPHSTQCKYNAEKLLPYDVLVIDECSMIDSALFAKTLSAVKPSARIILVGDAAQLPAVEPGNVLADLTAITHPSVVTLDQNYRSTNHINTVANAIINADLDNVIEYFAKHETLIGDESSEKQYQNSLEKIIKARASSIQDAIKTANKPLELLEAYTQDKVLTPIRNGKYGVAGLNRLFNECINPNAMNDTEPHYHGQAIIITENSPALGLNNGDVGVIWDRHFNEPEQPPALMAVIERKDKPFIELSVHRLPKFESAFAMTIHKTQGSEYANVLIVLPYEASEGCTRELLYTGVTRAKKEVILLSRKKVLADCLDKTNRRNTYLSQLLATERSPIYD